MTIDERYAEWDEAEKAANIHNQQKPRGGFPCKRDRKREPSLKKATPYSNFLDRFRLVGETLYTLHATRGWKKT